jgi:hypothetical protein
MRGLASPEYTQITLICVIPNPPSRRNLGEHIGGYRASYLGPAATIGNASRGNRESTGAAAATITVPGVSPADMHKGRRASNGRSP